MPRSNDRPEPIDIIQFRRHRNEFPDEQLEPYWGKQVAWRADGKAIVASGETHEELYAQLNALGVDPCEVVDEFIPDPNVSYS